MTPDDLERLIDDRLRRLPVPRAPGTLVPRVMQAVEEWSARPWYTRAWFTWPLGLRVASLAAAAVLLVGSAVLVPGAYETVADRVARVVGGVMTSPAAQRTEVAVTATRVVWRSLVAPIVPYALGLLILMYGACALAGTALSYLVLGKAHR